MMTKLEVTVFMAEWVANLETQREALQVMIDQGKQFITELQEDSGCNIATCRQTERKLYICSKKGQKK